MRTEKTERYWIKGAKKGERRCMLYLNTFEEACEYLTKMIEDDIKDKKSYGSEHKKSDYIIVLERKETIYDDDGFIQETNIREVTASTVRNV